MRTTLKLPSQFRLGKDQFRILSVLHDDLGKERPSVLSVRQDNKTNSALLSLFANGFVHLSRFNLESLGVSLTDAGVSFARFYGLSSTQQDPVNSFSWTEDQTRLLLYLYNAQGVTPVLLKQLADYFGTTRSRVSTQLLAISSDFIDYTKPPHFRSKTEDVIAAITARGIMFSNDILLPFVNGAQEVLDMIRLRSAPQL
jgi:hypothetical protein